MRPLGPSQQSTVRSWYGLQELPVFVGVKLVDSDEHEPRLLTVQPSQISTGKRHGELSKPLPPSEPNSFTSMKTRSPSESDSTSSAEIAVKPKPLVPPPGSMRPANGTSMRESGLPASVASTSGSGELRSMRAPCTNAMRDVSLPSTAVAVLTATGVRM